MIEMKAILFVILVSGTQGGRHAAQESMTVSFGSMQQCEAAKVEMEEQIQNKWTSFEQSVIWCHEVKDAN